MPLCQLYTSRRDDELKDGLELRIAETIAKTLGKPVERVTVVLQTNLRLLRMGTLEPACMLTISAIDVFDGERNPTYTPALKSVLQTELDLPAERCGVLYHDLDIKFCG